MGTFLVGSILLLTVVGVILKMIRDRKKGKGGCGQSCRDCPYGHHCEQAQKEKD